MKFFVSACLTLTLIAGSHCATSMTTFVGSQGLTMNVTNPGLTISVYRQINSAATSTPTPSTTLSSTTLQTSSSTVSSTTQTTTTHTTTTTPAPGRTDYINLNISGLKEVDVSGVAVTPQSGHMIGSSVLLTQMYNQTNAVATTVMLSPTVSASCYQFWASPLNGFNSTSTSSLNVTLCTTSTAGSITTSTETEPILAGQLIIYFNVNQWPWTQTGASLEMNVTLQVATGRVITRSRAANSNVTMRCAVGGSSSNDAYTDVSTMAWNDGLPMPQTVSPVLNPVAGGAYVNVTVRLPKPSISSTTFYMVVEPGWTSVKGGSGVVGAASRVIAINFWVMLVGVIVGVAVLKN